MTYNYSILSLTCRPIATLHVKELPRDIRVRRLINAVVNDFCFSFIKKTLKNARAAHKERAG